MSHYSTFSNCKSTKVQKDKPPSLVEGSFTLQGSQTRKYPSLLDYYRGAGYKDGQPFKKGMSNVSTVRLGDDRIRYDTTLMHDSLKMVDDAAKAAGVRKEVHVDHGLHSPLDCNRIYRMAVKTVGTDALKVMESSLRLKLAERTGGGAHQLRRAFRFFDKDGSGSIDLDEFSNALATTGFAYNETQLLALFGRYDSDLDGLIDYNEFVGGVMETDFDVDPYNRTVIANPPEMERAMKARQKEQTYQEEHAHDDTNEANEVSTLELEEVSRIFALVDRQRTGFIQADSDLPVLLAAVGLVGTTEQLQSARNHAMGEDGRIELEAFFKWWRAWKQQQEQPLPPPPLH